MIEGSGGRLRVVALSAHCRLERLLDQARQFQPRWIVATDAVLAKQFDWSSLPAGTQFLVGADALLEVVSAEEVDAVLAAIVGSAGLRSTWAALEAKKTVALANKETLVMAGHLMTRLAAERGARLLPVDSEHSAIFQALRAGRLEEVRRIVLTASGGPFRDMSVEQLKQVTIDEALAHPTWDMGPKISIDSATMMNKALEIIEAHWLFGLPAERISVVLHPQSMVHSMVEFVDGSVVAQISPPDMRLPIQYALTCPARLAGPARKLDLAELGSWTFETPDFERYPALRLGYEVVQRAGTSGAALNAANEVAVERFLCGDIRFREITALCGDLLRGHPYDARPTLDGLFAVDRWARQEASCWNRSTSLKS